MGERYEPCVGQKKFMKKLTLFLALAACVSAQAIVIDNFQAGPFDSGIVTTVGPLFVNSQVGPNSDIIGGVRETKMQLSQNTLGANGGSRMTVGSGLMAVNQAPLTDGQYSLFYGNPTHLLNLNLSSETAFKFDVLFNDLGPLQLNARIGTSGSGSSNAFLNIPVITSGPQTIIVNFSSFVGSANFADVDSIRFFFDPEVAGDFVIGGITTVPEPNTVLALTLGGVAVLLRKRTKK